MFKPLYFPNPDLADPEGVVAFGGQLSPAWLLDAYTHGIFPWPVLFESEVLVWFSPDPRAVFELDGFHASRRLLQTIRSKKFEVTCDEDFGGVIRNCAAPRKDDGGTWITPAMIDAYEEMHRRGIAHSVEVWHQGQLAGGTYGLSIGGLFAGESMFHRQRDASKVALYYLVRHLRARGYTLFDIQQLTDHTRSLGAIEIPRKVYLQRVATAVRAPVSWGPRLESGVEVGKSE